jgi:hypothetical protein
MKKLVAARPIQYMGRTYESGDAVPAYDGKMVEAWLAAGSVKWTGADVAEPEVKPTVNPDAQAADALRAMGLCITDDAGNFVGAENLAEQIRNIFPRLRKRPGGRQGGQGDGGQEKDTEHSGRPGGAEKYQWTRTAGNMPRHDIGAESESTKNIPRRRSPP